LNGDELQVSVEAYDQVAAMATNAAYLYYMGDQWKIGKVAEIPPAKLRKADNILSTIPFDPSEMMLIFSKSYGLVLFFMISLRYPLGFPSIYLTFVLVPVC
jgi:hypothetical protein